MSSQKDYIEKNKERFVEELFTLLRIPSISADSTYHGDVMKTAEAVSESYCICGKNG
jgi:acetylornithine deacetylase/succinyl-diaminopimelate desuccinylase-like protein